MTPSDQSDSDRLARIEKVLAGRGGYNDLGPEKPNYCTVRVSAHDVAGRDQRELGARPHSASFDFSWDRDAPGAEDLLDKAMAWLAAEFPEYAISANISRWSWKGHP